VAVREATLEDIGVDEEVDDEEVDTAAIGAELNGSQIKEPRLQSYLRGMNDLCENLRKICLLCAGPVFSWGSTNMYLVMEG
jgi:hypothetical protein